MTSLGAWFWKINARSFVCQKHRKQPILDIFLPSVYKIGRLFKIERLLSKPDVFFKNNQKYTPKSCTANSSRVMEKTPNDLPHEIGNL
jgi:hypothetical protein